MLRLGVNVDHVATLRQARYKGCEWGEPDPVEAALACLEAGAHGITAHLREDRRHMLDRDLIRLREAIDGWLNFEMANTEEMCRFAVSLKPNIVCLVPEKRQEVTTEGGLDVYGSQESLKQTCGRMRDAGIEVSLFIDPDAKQIEAAACTGAGFIELHTGAFAEAARLKISLEKEVERLNQASRRAQGLGLRVNAGHGLTVRNLPLLLDVPFLEELNIGHHLVSRAMMIGLPGAVREMLGVMAAYQGGVI